MTSTDIALTTLVYNGEVIRDRNEMLSLTDMWKSCGAPEGRRPDDWKKDGAHREFMEHVALVLNAPVEGIWKGTRGVNGGTMAHWQIGLAYAKWVNHDLHMWCNTVVRERMDGAVQRGANLQPAAITFDAEMRKVLGGIVKSVIHSQLTDIMPTLVAGYVAEHNLSIADGVTAGEVCDLSAVTANYPRGISARVSRKMTQFCAVKKVPVPVTRLGRVRAQLFPTHIAREWLDIEGRALIRRWMEEKTGQRVLPFAGRNRSEGKAILKIGGKSVLVDLDDFKVNGDEKAVFLHLWDGGLSIGTPEHFSGSEGRLGYGARPGHDRASVVILGKVLERTAAVPALASA